MLTQQEKDILSDMGEEVIEGSRDHTEVDIIKIPRCDFCMAQGIITDALYDGCTKNGHTWANMCQLHYQMNGVGVGLGRGQRLILKEETKGE
jgi:hypothetical protein